MAGRTGHSGRRPKASTIVERQRRQGRDPSARTGRRPRLPGPPSHLPTEAQQEWRRVVRRLGKVGLVDDLDTAALEAYCLAYVRWHEAEAQIRRYGTVVKSPNGFPMPSPYLAIANKAMEQMLRVLGEFGMTPSSRSRLPVKEPETPRWHPRYIDDGPDPRKYLEGLK